MILIRKLKSSVKCFALCKRRGRLVIPPFAGIAIYASDVLYRWEIYVNISMHDCLVRPIQ